MPSLSDLERCELALLLISDDDGVVVFTGNVLVMDDALYFEHGGEPPGFFLPDDSLNRIKPIDKTDEALADIFGEAEFVLPLSVGNLPDDEASHDGKPTGLKWPDD